MSPIAPLRCGDQVSRDPADNNPEIMNHREDNNQTAKKWGEVKTKDSERRADQNAVDQRDQELPAEVSDDVAVDLRKRSSHFVFERGVAQREIFLPAALDRWPLL